MQIFILWREISDIAKVLWKSLSHKTCPTVCWKEIKLVHISVSDTIYFYNTVYTIRLTGISLALINSSQEFHWGTKSLDCSANMKDCNFSLLQRIFLRKFRNNVNHGRQWTPISLELWNTLYVGKKEKKKRKGWGLRPEAPQKSTEYNWLTIGINFRLLWLLWILE